MCILNGKIERGKETKYGRKFGRETDRDNQGHSNRVSAPKLKISISISISIKQNERRIECNKDVLTTTTMKWLDEWKQMLQAYNEMLPQIGGIYSKSPLYLSLHSNVHNILVCISQISFDFVSLLFSMPSLSIQLFNNNFISLLFFLEMQLDTKLIKTFF